MVIVNYVQNMITVHLFIITVYRFYRFLSVLSVLSVLSLIPVDSSIQKRIFSRRSTLRRLICQGDY